MRDNSVEVVAQDLFDTSSNQDQDIDMVHLRTIRYHSKEVWEALRSKVNAAKECYLSSTKGDPKYQQSIQSVMEKRKEKYQPIWDRLVKEVSNVDVDISLFMGHMRFERMRLDMWLARFADQKREKENRDLSDVVRVLGLESKDNKSSVSAPEEGQSGDKSKSVKTVTSSASRRALQSIWRTIR